MALPVVGVAVRFAGQYAIESALEKAALNLSGRAIKSPRKRLLVRGAIKGASLAHRGRSVYEFFQEDEVEITSDLATGLMKPVENYIKRNTPVDTGRLRDSTATRLTVQKSRQGQGVVVKAEAGWIGKRPRKRVVARVVEYGSEDRQGERIVRKAVDKFKGATARALAEGVYGMIESKVTNEFEAQKEKTATTIQGASDLAAIAQQGANYLR